MKQTTLLHDSLGRTTSRRQVLLGGLAAIIAAGEAPASIIRSNLGGVQQSIEAGGGDFQIPYVTDGLTAMWDGEWNVGGGEHDAAATTWKDLSGNNLDFSLVSGNFSWLDDAILGSPRSLGRIGNLSVSTLGKVGFIEFVGNSAYGVGNGNTQPSGVILEGGMTAGCLALRIRGYASRKTCQLLAGAYNASWYNNGYSVYSEDRIVYCAGEITDTSVGDVYYAGQQITPFVLSENWSTSPLVCLGAYRTNDARYPYTGSINSLRIYSRALTAEEVAYNYAIDKERFGLP